MVIQNLSAWVYPALVGTSSFHENFSGCCGLVVCANILVWASGYPLPLISLLHGECHTKPRTCWALSAESAVFLSSLPRGQVGKVLHGTRPCFSSLSILRGFKATFPTSEQRVLSCAKVPSPGSWACWRKEYPIHRTGRSTAEKELVTLWRRTLI